MKLSVIIRFPVLKRLVLERFHLLLPCIRLLAIGHVMIDYFPYDGTVISANKEVNFYPIILSGLLVT